MARGLKGIKKPHPLGSVPTRSGASQLSVVPAASSATASGPGVKISELPAASAASASDQLEVNQNGISRRVTVGQLFGSYIEGTEITAPAAPATNSYRLYAEDNGAGKTRLMVKFATGAAVQLAIEP